MIEYGYFKNIRDNKEYEVTDLLVPKASLVKCPSHITHLEIQQAWKNHVRVFSSTKGSRSGEKIRMPHINNKLYCRFYLHDTMITIEYEVEFIDTRVYLKAVMVSDSLNGIICTD